MTSDSDPIQNKYSSRGSILSIPVHLGSVSRWRESKGEIVDLPRSATAWKRIERHWSIGSRGTIRAKLFSICWIQDWFLFVPDKVETPTVIGVSPVVLWKEVKWELVVRTWVEVVESCARLRFDEPAVTGRRLRVVQNSVKVRSNTHGHEFLRD